MADEPDPDKTRNARFKILIHEDPANDTLILYVDFRKVHVRLTWKDGERQDVIDLLAQGTWFLDRGHIEYETHRAAAEIDKDLGSLFPEDIIDEEVEDGE